MIELYDLGSFVPRKKKVRVGRGNGSRFGTTCGRGMKGAGSRSGYKKRLGNEGGNLPFFRRFPKRGFGRGNLAKPLDVINLDQIDALFSDGEEVTLASLKEKGFFSGPSYGLKVLGRGELKKKVSVSACKVSRSARLKLDENGIECVTAR
ncbi:LSU ribosomal protein L15p (L27Ae) [Candidatus Similichlamydia laticola]|uniref:Large ribosomal subunit protein uL15 n=1 Tax=Candidatus Similichlamydia laticola TaxID=2170265 RepID=A0A369KFB9_9BACT|nr:50S ribosomal protein L15 [Candidatus Similichlamydia laticola]RDB31395.1 LSU ribosomal protein L15p (L27Ae) [Candidatus Similichlamydia laticola]